MDEDEQGAVDNVAEEPEPDMGGMGMGGMGGGMGMGGLPGGMGGPGGMDFEAVIQNHFGSDMHRLYLFFSSDDETDERWWWRRIRRNARLRRWTFWIGSSRRRR